MIKALIIGTGNIGAFYDINSDSIITYAKAFFCDKEINFDIYDINKESTHIVASKYGCGVIDDINNISFENYDIVSICTPTSEHYNYLSKTLIAGVRLILCEKPIDTDLERLLLITNLYNKSKSKVIVNYYRRFQLTLLELQEEISKITSIEKCTNIVIKYQRGVHNNFSHALDLLTFLFKASAEMENVIKWNEVYDEFENDPTLSFACHWNKSLLQAIGLNNVKFSFFEIEIYFNKQYIILSDGASKINHFETQTGDGRYYPKPILLYQREGLFENYMIDVINYAKKILKDNSVQDNFRSSVEISNTILNFSKVTI